MNSSGRYKTFFSEVRLPRSANPHHFKKFGGGSPIIIGIIKGGHGGGYGGGYGGGHGYEHGGNGGGYGGYPVGGYNGGGYGGQAQAQAQGT